MLHVYKIRPEKRESLCAVNHVDDTGRLQTVTREENPMYYDLISAFHRKTGIPVILNTSFNEKSMLGGSDAELVTVPKAELVGVVFGAANGDHQRAIEYLMAENRVLRKKLGTKRIPLTDDDRRVLAVKGKALVRRLLEHVATIVTPDTLEG